MHIQVLHKNIYKLYAYGRTQECLDAYWTCTDKIESYLLI
jgi:hypothetical protein